MPEQQNYSKISAVALWLGTNASLKMNVGLFHNNKDMQKQNYHSEFSFYDKNINAMMNSMRLQYDYYLSIENFSRTEYYEKEFIKIGIMEMPIFINALARASLWFLSQEFDGLFYQTKSGLKLKNIYDPVIIMDLPMDKVIRFEPRVVLGYENTEFQGVRMYINNDLNYTDMILKKFMGFKYFMETANLFMMGQSLVNYLSRPNFGTNSKSMQAMTSLNNLTLGSNGLPGRHVQGQ